MTVFQAIVLGVLQGLAEFLPISSSAHLSLAPWLFGWRDPGLAFDVALHVGTLAAVLWYFREEWRRLIVAGLAIVRQRRVETEEERRLMYLVLATIPGAIGGLLLEDYAETTFRAPALTASALIVAGVLLWAADRYAASTRPLAAMRWQDALVIGLAQVAALVPGVSRSGSTMIAGRALSFDRPSAAVFSFLMSMPITAAAAILKVPEALREGISAPIVAGVLAAGISGWLAIAVLLRYISRHSFGVFALYRVLLGIAVLGFVYARARGRA
ncbi:MAG TPA: undecaprenyl-diphosphatase UppP [Gemmatimonadaceae bacterium]|nr:undecaprenyl-diphosphatase UppP [Gemmatimonadaceae bacterium]